MAGAVAECRELYRASQRISAKTCKGVRSPFACAALLNAKQRITSISATGTFLRNRGKRWQPLRCLRGACASVLTELCLCGGITQLVVRKQCEKENP